MQRSLFFLPATLCLLVAITLSTQARGVPLAHRVNAETPQSQFLVSDGLILDAVREYEGTMVLNFRLKDDTIQLGDVGSIANVFNGIRLPRGVDASSIIDGLRAYDIKVSYHRQAGVFSLFFDQVHEQRVVLATYQIHAAAGRLRVQLFLERPLNLDAVYALGEARYMAGAQDEAIRIWQFVLSRYGLHRETVYQMAGVYFEQGDYEAAEALYETSIDLDERNWAFPEARIRYALSLDNQDKMLSKKHVMCLEEYIRHGKGASLHTARMLLIQAKYPVSLVHLSSQAAEDLHAKIEQTRQSVVYFWSPDCTSCRQEMNALFAFAVKHRAIDFYLVSADDANRLKALELSLSKQFAPYRSKRGHSNVHFLLDTHRYLWQAMLPSTLAGEKIFPKTLFLEKQTVVRYENGPANWMKLHPVEIWNKR